MKQLCLVRGRQSFAKPIEKIKSDLSFKVPQLAAHCRLGCPQGGRGCRHTLIDHDSVEDLHLALANPHVAPLAYRNEINAAPLVYLSA